MQPFFLSCKKTEPVKNGTLKRSVFEWIRNSNVQYSNPHCINLNHEMVYYIHKQCLVQVEHTHP